MPDKAAGFDIEIKASEKPDVGYESDGEGKIKDFMRLNTEQCLTSCNLFKKDLMAKLFNDDRKRVSWKYMYYTIKSFGIYATKTTIWNLFLDPKRKVLTQLEDDNPKLDKLSETFVAGDVTDDRANFLFHMTESYNIWKKRRVRRWNKDMLEEMFTQKFLQGKGFNFVCAGLIAIISILLTNIAIFPIGEGIFDTVVLCRIVLITYSIGWVWYLFSLLGERWYPSTYGGLALNSIFMVASFIFCVLFFHYVSNPTYYDDRGCFKCPLCTETTDKLCYEYNRFYSSINNEFAEANTCSCALVERLRINEPIIPYGKQDTYCGGDDCSCDAILDLSDENWSNSQEYYNCVYFSYGGTMFFYFGTLAGIFMLIDFILSFTSFLYWLMMWLGCGRGPFSNCICCGIDFDLEQRRARSKLRRASMQIKLG